MEVHFEARKQQLLDECSVAPEVFDRVMPRLERFIHHLARVALLLLAA